jgi:hypothetical protein
MDSVYHAGAGFQHVHAGLLYASGDMYHQACGYSSGSSIRGRRNDVYAIAVPVRYLHRRILDGSVFAVPNPSIGQPQEGNANQCKNGKLLVFR